MVAWIAPVAKVGTAPVAVPADAILSAETINDANWYNCFGATTFPRKKSVCAGRSIADKNQFSHFRISYLRFNRWMRGSNLQNPRRNLEVTTLLKLNGG
jgi:hypothetical protein